jgi:lipid A ethanolaminephosphotransferase
MIRRRLFRFGAAGEEGAPSGRWTLRVETLALLASLFFTLACNGGFWRQVLQGRDAAAPGTWAFAAGLGVALTALQFVPMALVFTRWTARPLLALLIAATALATWYMRRYGVYLDPSMLRNVLRTDVKEARELFAWSMVPHLLLYAALPLALLWRVRVAALPLASAAWRRAGWLLLAMGVAAAALAGVFQDFAALTRNHKEMRFLITPGNYLWSLGRVALQDARAAARPREVVGPDAARGPLAAAPGARPTLVVLVVGETARASNWGLNGYARGTAPQLAAMPDVISFAQASSCGTNTEVSLPCMFSPWGRRNYDEARIRGAESALHVLQRAGVRVAWRDNQSGCKGVCEGVAVELMARAKVPGLCDGGRCLDEVLLHDIDRVLEPAGDQLLVLHQMGEHGPAYFSRYPEAYHRFTPTCDTADLRLCTREQIVNAYDNAMLYTDHVLARTITWLRERQATHDTALVYLSDHGESLGEANLYLHGMPWAIAPKVQTHVPMLMWMSPGYAARWRIDTDCLRQRAAQPVSHDHLFHALMGLFDVTTRARDPAYDLAGACRKS